MASGRLLYDDDGLDVNNGEKNHIYLKYHNLKRI